MSKETSIQNLFNQVSEISQKYRDEIERSGLRFNIFKILGRTTDEVKHSVFIAELLNPKGAHGNGTLFLEKFVAVLNQKRNIGFDALKTKDVITEYYTGRKTDIDGGFIDILLKDELGNEIIIENKINAGDQDNQLLRYDNYGKNAPLIYLTKYGTKPSNYSTRNNQSVSEKLICISYERDIVDWLEKCVIEIKMHDHVKETIRQYITLIKEFTGQTMNKKMTQEIVNKIVEKEDNLSTAFDIVRSINDVKQHLLNCFVVELKKKVSLFTQVAEDKTNVGFCMYFSTKLYRVRLLTLSNYSELYLDIMTESHAKKDNEAVVEFTSKINSKGWGEIPHNIASWGNSNWGIKLDLLSSDSPEKWKELLPSNLDKTTNKVSEYVSTLVNVVNQYADKKQQIV